MSDIVVTGMGMISSLGSAVTACMAAYAGLSRPEPVNNGRHHKISGHPCPFVKGFEGLARLSSLIALAFQDLGRSLEAIKLTSENTAFFLNLPGLNERPSLLEQYQSFDSERLFANKAPISFKQLFVQCLDDLMALDIRPDSDSIQSKGHAGMIEMLLEACCTLSAQEKPYCIIGGVDSAIDLKSQEYLNGRNYLKSPKNPTGQMPGEGAVLLLLEHRRMAEKRGATILGGIGAFETGEEKYAFDDRGLVPDGLQLSSTIDKVLSDTLRGDQNIHCIINDMNGVENRSKEWGFAIPRLGQKYSNIRDAEMMLPATAFGDVGAAAAGFLILMAITGLNEGFIDNEETLVCASSDDGLRGAVIIEKGRR